MVTTQLETLILGLKTELIVYTRSSYLSLQCSHADDLHRTMFGDTLFLLVVLRSANVMFFRCMLFGDDFSVPRSPSPKVAEDTSSANLHRYPATA